MSDPAPPRGHNLPSLADLLSPETIEAIIEAEVGPLKARAAALTASVVRFLQAHPEIKDDEQDSLAAEVLATLQRFMASTGRIETSRVTLKAPILAAGRAIDLSYKEIGPELAIRSIKERRPPLTLAETVLLRSVAFKTEKNRIAQAEAAAEAKRLAEAAKAAEDLADRGSGTISYADAAAAAEAADRARQQAEARPAERTRTHGGDFGTTSLAQKRVFTITDRNAVPRHLCEPSEALIRAAIGKAGDPIPTIAGVSVRDENDLTVRR